VLGDCSEETRRMSRRKTKLEIRELNLRIDYIDDSTSTELPSPKFVRA
jgi:hypothetical protein